MKELEDWLKSLVPFARNHELGEIDELFEAALNGELHDSEDTHTPIKPIRKDPEIYELRRTALTKMLRFYHGEPEEHPDIIVHLHKHIKQDTSSQQEEIEHAARRYRHGVDLARIVADQLPDT
ncbi:hypothetical protein EII12_06000 [Buchananella hordeovulneris]|uniref:hypothetical protein n=1 Tax=Buchananella hordeovulneris TaxID=52770 RepID=UPI000F5EA876|nr:hypothetical protein [Buchananella hordeovulneris]RRD52095.1 hypothetical protein EII12_06000 [Buchananella hordeovulneris]